jgi:3-oxoacyl-[acyl-carrier-protein] synthase-1
MAVAPTLAALQAGRSGLRGRSTSRPPARHLAGCGRGHRRPGLADPDLAFDCRNNRLAELGLRADGFAERVRQAAQRFGAARIGVFLGTSTAASCRPNWPTAIATRPPVRCRPDLNYAQTHNTYSVARYVRAALGLQGPAHVVSARPVLPAPRSLLPRNA